MGEMITKPDANPILFALLNGFMGCVGYFIMGQQKKAIVSFVYLVIISVVLTTCTFGLGGILAPIWMLATMYDAYLLGQKLAQGESIGMTENGLELLDKLPGFN